MTRMNELTDKVIIFFSCVCIYLFQPVLEVSVVPIILTIIIINLLSYLEQDLIRLILYFGYLILCLIMPALTLFIPLIIYDFYQQNFQGLLLVAILPLMVNRDHMGLMLWGTIIALIVMVLWLKNRSMKLFEMKIKYNHLSDDAREMSVKLKAQNKELLDQMDIDTNLATLKERNRIAREIHDHVGHQISRAILQIGALLVVSNEEKIKEPLTSVNNTLSQAMNSIRDSVHDLHDRSVDLHSQIEELLKQFTFCEVTLQDEFITQPEKKLRLAFIGIIKEALSNIMKHSNATKAELLLREHPAFYQLIIRDNGQVKSMNRGNGIGLYTMTERIEAFKGNINFSKENGFEIFITVPKGKGENR